jgi:pyrroloquinoline quinone (PQQ) biosynthesis protein C
MMLNWQIIKSLLEKPWGQSEQDATQVAATLLEARQLANAAYSKEDRKSFEESEKILYLINTSNCFGKPLQDTPSLVYGTLLRAKLSSVLKSAEQNIPLKLNFEEMKKALENLVNEADQKDHTLIDEIGNSESWKGLLLYSKNWVVTAYGFLEQLALLLQHCQGDARHIVQENIADEFEGTPHPILRNRFLQRIGIQYHPIRALEDEDYLVEAMSVLNFRTGISSLNDPYYALGSFYTVEAVFCLISGRLKKILPKFKIQEEAYEMFHLHSTVDQDHAIQWMQGIEGPHITPQQRSRVVVGATAQMKIRHQLFEAMRNRLRI